MASNQPAQVRIGRDVAATRKSRSRNWPAQSTVYERYDSLTDYSNAIAGQVQGIGKGMTAGRDLLAYFNDVDNTPRLKYNIQCEHGRSKKQWPQYPHPSRTIIPVGTSLEQVCQFYPLHCWADGLRIFMAENWTAEKIWSLIPEDARNTGAAVRPWNYLQQAMGREADKMYEEDDNGPRVVPKRKRDEMEGEEEIGSVPVQTPPEKRQKLTPKSKTMPPSQLTQQSIAIARQQMMNMTPRQMMTLPNMRPAPQQILPITNVRAATQQTIAVSNGSFVPQQNIIMTQQHVVPLNATVTRQQNITVPTMPSLPPQSTAQSNTSIRGQQLNTFQKMSMIDEDGIDWSDSPYQPVEMVAVQNSKTDYSSLELAMLLQNESRQIDFGLNNGDISPQCHSANLNDHVISQDQQAAATDSSVPTEQPVFDYQASQLDDLFEGEIILPSIEADADQDSQVTDPISDKGKTLRVSDVSASDGEKSDDPEAGDVSASEFIGEPNSDDGLDSLFEFNDEDFNFDDEDKLKPSDGPILIAKPAKSMGLDASKDHALAIQLAQGEVISTSDLDAVIGLSEAPKSQPFRAGLSTSSSQSSYTGGVDPNVFTPESLTTLDDSLLFSCMVTPSINEEINEETLAVLMGISPVDEPQLSQFQSSNGYMASQYMQSNSTPYMMPAQSYGMMQDSMAGSMPQKAQFQQQGYFPQQSMGMMQQMQPQKQYYQQQLQYYQPQQIVQPQQQVIQSQQQMMQPYMSSSMFASVNQGYGQRIPNQMMAYQPIPQYNMQPISYNQNAP